MKGPLASMICAMAELKRSGTKLKGDLIFCGVADEEEAGIGTRSLIEIGPEATYAIIGEPTDMHIALGHKGLEWIDVIFKGKKVPGGDPRCVRRNHAASYSLLYGGKFSAGESGGSRGYRNR